MEEDKKNLSISYNNQPQEIYIGSYSDSQPRPSIYQFIPKRSTTLKLLPEFINPSFVYYNKVQDKNLLYIVQQIQNGHLIVLDIDKYEIIQKVRTFGDDPCHIQMNQSKKLIVVCNYTSGSFVVYKVKDDGLIEQGTHMFVLHQGSGPVISRQASAHVHSSLFVDKDQQDHNVQQVLLVADLGNDTITYYTISQNYTTIKNHPENTLKTQGTGPRHMSKGPKNTKMIFMCGQLDSSIRILSYQNKKIQTLSAYKVSNNLSNYPSQIKFIPQSNQVYLACRGDDYLIAFDFIENIKGSVKLFQLKQKFRFKVGQWPRHFNVSDSNTIYVACQFKNIVQRFKVSEQGKIFQLGSLKISSPSCIAFKQ